ncbi:hypothetical protein BDR07DRAFT_1415437, partial [Suillus spraguei]
MSSSTLNHPNTTIMIGFHRYYQMLYSEVVNETNLLKNYHSLSNSSTHSCTSSSGTLSCLRAADVNTLQTLNNNIDVDGFFGTLVFVPVVDSTFILERPASTIRKGRLNSNYLLSVTNSYEGNIFVNQSTTLNIAEYGEFAIPPRLHGTDVAFYFTSDLPPYNNWQFITAFLNSFMAMAMFETLDHRYTPGDITPSWSTWQDDDLTGMKSETDSY